MTGHHSSDIDALERIESLRESLRATLDTARRVIDTTRRIQDAETSHYAAAIQRIERANAALVASVGLMD